MGSFCWMHGNAGVLAFCEADCAIELKVAAEPEAALSQTRKTTLNEQLDSSVGVEVKLQHLPRCVLEILGATSYPCHASS